MICRSCRSSMLLRMQQPQTATWASSVKRQLPIVRSQIRFYSDKGTNPPVAAPPPPPNPRQPTVGDASAPSAISSATPGVSQPLSTPEGVHTDAQPAASTKPAVERPPSSCPAGTVMNGLNYFKNKPDVVAKDSEYPDWLWDLLTDSSKQAKSEKGGFIYEFFFRTHIFISSLEQKATEALREETRRSHRRPSPKIPAHHHAEDIVPAPYNRQTIPEDAMLDATEGQIKRSEVTKSAREARRKAIKESNFLRGL
ncbi:hypothetical protein N7470_004965 [Penicillium chermesinum]|nr:hypothetical protein N7470_004965 [Penicillium chermesinum]